jgi:Fe-S-cluster containining protein
VKHDVEALRALYARVDERLSSWSCEASTDCCHFERTGREPLLWPNEWALLSRALAERGGPSAVIRKRRLPLVDDEGRCPLLDEGGRCRVYESRPFGCRTFFCSAARGDERKLPRDAIQAFAREVVELAQKVDPRCTGPRTLRSWLGLAK